MAALALTYWPFFCRTVYAEMRRPARRRCSSRPCRASAPRTARIVFLHMLPNVASPIDRARATIRHGLHHPDRRRCWASSASAPRRPIPDWGLAIAESRKFLPQTWWFATFPGLAILIAVLGFNLLGDGLRDLVDLAPEAVAMSDALLKVRQPQPFDQPATRARRSILDRVDLEIPARPAHRRRRALGCVEVADPDRACPRRPADACGGASTPARSCSKVA